MRQADVSRLTAHLRQLLGSPGLRLVVPSHGQTPQLRIGRGNAEQTIGTVDLDEDGDFVITIAVLRDELAEPAARV